MANYRRGKSYRRRRTRIMITDPNHAIKRDINQLRREIDLAQQIAAHFGIEATGLGVKQERLANLEKQLEGVTR